MLRRGKLTCAGWVASGKGWAPLVLLISGRSGASQLLGKVDLFGGISLYECNLSPHQTQRWGVPVESRLPWAQDAQDKMNCATKCQGPWRPKSCMFRSKFKKKKRQKRSLILCQSLWDLMQGKPTWLHFLLELVRGTHAHHINKLIPMVAAGGGWKEWMAMQARYENAENQS